MQVTLRSDTIPDVKIETSGEACGLRMLEQHIRALQTAHRWLKKELRLKREREAAAFKAQKQNQTMTKA